MEGDDKKDPERPALAKYMRYYHLGITFFVGIGLFTLAGVWLDRELGTVVLFTLLGLALGFGGSLRSMYRDLYGDSRQRTQKDSVDAEAKPGGDGPVDHPDSGDLPSAPPETDSGDSSLAQGKNSAGQGEARSEREDEAL